MQFHPFTFTGKERDAETGYSYFGARYYDSDLSGLFSSVDPMAYKYPSLSPYVYCAWNSLKLVDPNGREVINAHAKKVCELQKKIADLQNQINNCNDKKQLRSLNKILKESQSSLKKEIEYEKLVDNAIQDLKDYGGDEFKQLDNLENINGEKVDVYIQMKSDIGGVNNPKCGLTEMSLLSDGNCRSDHPTAIQDGHYQGNPSGLFANQCENAYCQRKKR